MRRNLHSSRLGGFTLVELLVVIGIIALLMGILFPALAAARERAQRVVCGNGLRQLMNGVHMYANENKGLVPDGRRDHDRWEHCVWISHPTYQVFTRYASGTPNLDPPPPSGTIGDKGLACPNMLEPLGVPFYAPPHGWVIGYNYLAGHPRINEVHTSWKSPLRVNEKGDLPVFADWVGYANAPGGWTSVPHQRRGGGGHFYPPGGPKQPKDLWATGGNVARLDGSVVWKDITEMKPYPDSLSVEYIGYW